MTRICTSAKAEPTYQCDCEHCGKELFDGTPRESYRLCQDCATETPEAVAARQAQQRSDEQDYRAWRAS